MTPGLTNAGGASKHGVLFHPQPPIFPSSTTAATDRSRSKASACLAPPNRHHVANRRPVKQRDSGAGRCGATLGTRCHRAAFDRGHPPPAFHWPTAPGRPMRTGALPLWTAISYRKGAMGSGWRHLRPKFPHAEGETACLHRGAGDHGDSTRRRRPLSRLNPPDTPDDLLPWTPPQGQGRPSPTAERARANPSPRARRLNQHRQHPRQ